MSANLNDLPIRFTYLKQVGRSPAHALASMQRDAKATSEMNRGTAVHHILFDTCRVVAYPGATRRGKEWEKFEADHDGCHIVTKTEYEDASRMSDAIRRHGLAAELIRDAVYEQTVRFEIDGRACRATPDALVPGVHLVDVKTGETADPRQFHFKARRFCYHGQLEFYQRVTRVPNAYVVAVEAEYPYPVTVFQFDQDTRMRAADLVDSRWALLRHCEETGHWPGYAEEVVTLNVPADYAEAG